MELRDETTPPGSTMHLTDRGHSPRVVLFSTSLAVFAVFLDTTIGFVSFPAISATFHRSGADTLSWVLNAYTLVFAAMLVPAGRLADRIGRRGMFLLGVVVFTCGSMLCGLSPNVGILIVAEMLEALGAAILVPASLALVLQTFPKERIPVAVAIWGAIGAAAGAAGPTIGALVVSNLSWRWAFFINLPVGIISFTLGRIVLPEGRERNPGRLPDAWSLVALVAGVAAITYAIVESSRWGWGSVRFLIWIAVGAALVVAFVGRSRSVPNPVVRMELFGVRNFRWANAATIVYAVGFNAMFLGNILFLTRVWHYSILRAGLAVSLGPLIVATTAPRFGKLAGRVGQRRLLVPGGLLWVLGHHHPELRRRLPPRDPLHGVRRGDVPAPAVVRRRPEPAARPARHGLRGRAVAAQPWLHVRCRARHRVHHRGHRQRRAHQLPPCVVAARWLRPGRVAAGHSAVRTAAHQPHQRCGQPGELIPPRRPASTLVKRCAASHSRRRCRRRAGSSSSS
jgi:EmrB/QacA subfamily drug resistance transporter